MILDTNLHNFYLQITAFILEILQPLVVQFLVVGHVSSSGYVRYNQTRGFSLCAVLVPFSPPLVKRLFSAVLSAVHTGNAGGGGQPRAGVEEGWGNPLHSHWLHWLHVSVCRHTS